VNQQTETWCRPNFVFVPSRRTGGALDSGDYQRRCARRQVEAELVRTDGAPGDLAPSPKPGSMASLSRRVCQPSVSNHGVYITTVLRRPEPQECRGRKTARRSTGQRWRSTPWASISVHVCVGCSAGQGHRLLAQWWPTFFGLTPVPEGQGSITEIRIRQRTPGVPNQSIGKKKKKKKKKKKNKRKKKKNKKKKKKKKKEKKQKKKKKKKE